MGYFGRSVRLYPIHIHIVWLGCIVILNQSRPGVPPLVNFGMAIRKRKASRIVVIGGRRVRKIFRAPNARIVGGHVRGKKCVINGVSLIKDDKNGCRPRADHIGGFLVADVIRIPMRDASG